ncbi:MAG: hypothetical protein SGBAC_005908 [Bacillariaceae sp.]
MKFSVSTFLFTLAVFQSGERASAARRRLETEAINFRGPGCVDYEPGAEWTALHRNDDEFVELTNIGIDFDWFGEIKNALYINNNGNLSFDTNVLSYDPNGFTAGSTDMIAPFWADVDTRGAVDGYIWYRTIGDKFIVTWEEVARYGGDVSTPLIDTFQVVLSDVASSDPKICFCYETMEWYWGTATSVRQAQVGIAGDGNVFNIGLFDRNDSTWNGLGSSGNGINYLVDRSWCFNPDAAITTPSETDVIRTDTTTIDDRTESGPGGDPHFTTWNNEHYEYHGQCDLALVKDADFAEGLGLDIQIRTKVVRYWSYIKSVAIKIGNNILEIEGSGDADDAEPHYWINYEYQGPLETFAGFPVTQKLPSVYKRQYIIELSRGASITVQLYKEFIRVKFNGKESDFGNAVGLLGDYSTGKLLARDGSTVIDDFTEFGDEWQVLPHEPKLFHEVTHPQFPELCIKPEDPRGERKRRLAESNISIEAAEAACGAALTDPFTIKDCVYDILATQDMDMVGAF